MGDVVIISSDDKKRGKWSWGVIERLIIGKDGVIRVAIVRTGKSKLERAVHRFYPLELSCDKPVRPEPASKTLKLDIPEFRPRRDAAVAAEIRVQELHEDERK